MISKAVPVAIVLALLADNSITAFAPVPVSLKVGTTSRSTSNHVLRITTGPNGKPASSKEEDLKLTYEIIMNQFASPDEAAASIADEPAAEKPQKKKKKKKKSPPAEQAPVEMDVSKLDIRVGVIQKAWEHEDADKLFCEEIDIGEEGGPRQIASGLRAYYSADDLVGRKVLVLSNLKSRKLVGFPSHGMVLCASDDEKVVFVDPPADAEIGERVSCEGFVGDPATENQVGKKKILDKVFPDLLTNDDGVATYKGVPLRCGSGDCVAQGGLANAQVS